MLFQFQEADLGEHGIGRSFPVLICVREGSGHGHGLGISHSNSQGLDPTGPIYSWQWGHLCGCYHANAECRAKVQVFGQTLV